MFPENSLLSHDLLEGIHARVGFVSDVEVVDDYPSNVVVHARRQHRWTRGDWQLLPWIFPWGPGRERSRRSVLPAMGLWKVLDNLRRSMVPAGIFLGFVAAWTMLPGSPLGWTLALIGVTALPVLRLLMRLRAGPDRREPLGGRDALPGGAGRHDLASADHAPAPPLSRLDPDACHRRDPAADVRHEGASPRVGDRSPGPCQRFATLGRFLGAMVVSPASAVAIGAAIAVVRPAVLPVAAPLLGFWLIGTLHRGMVSRPLRTVRTELPAADRTKLRRLARKTWRYFDTFMREEHHDLPPDNYQEAPVEAVASRTSPTNIGMGLVSTLAAFDLGFIPARRLADQLQRNAVDRGVLGALRRASSQLV